MSKRWSTFQNAVFCPATDKILSKSEEFNSRGVCPHCGNISGSTITHGEVKTRQVTYESKWFGLLINQIESTEWRSK